MANGHLPDNSHRQEAWIWRDGYRTPGRSDHARSLAADGNGVPEPPIGAVSGRGSSLVLTRMSGRYAAGQVMRLDRSCGWISRPVVGGKERQPFPS